MEAGILGEIRDAERTRKKILAAAAAEFAAHGYAGARIEGIARRAGLSKQLLYHYFAGKEALFDEIVEQRIQERISVAGADGPPQAIFSQRFRAALDETMWLRFLTWEAAAYPSSRRITRQPRREASLKAQREALAARLAQSELPAEASIEMVQLAYFALATYPLTFPQITRMVTGRTTGDESFRRDWAAFLDRLGAALIRPKQQPSGGARTGRRRSSG